jgi:alkanesulfonate monooxygenase SsuD/methylene tetrahydromethanopterin reductase-like flavin-dependent oxidoreductase (luciferase family)
MVGVPTAVAKTFEEAKRQLEDGTQYFFDVLQGGINRAQQLVVSQTRFHADDTLIRPVNKDQTMKSTPVEERIENGQVLCGTPEMVIDQINRMHAALNHGHMNLIVKVGNMSDDFVLRSMKLLGQHVFPEVKKLGKTEKVAAE